MHHECFSLMADMRDPKLVPKIAKQFQRFHHVEIPGSKEPLLWNDIWKFFEKGSFFFPVTNVIFVHFSFFCFNYFCNFV